MLSMKNLTALALRRPMFWPVFLCCFLAVGQQALQSEQNDVDKMDLADIMRHTMTKGLCKKAIMGKASESELDYLLKLFQRMQTLAPPKGSPESWKQLTHQLTTATKKLKESGSGHKELRRAANCNACHRLHRTK